MNIYTYIYIYIYRTALVVLQIYNQSVSCSKSSRLLFCPDLVNLWLSSRDDLGSTQNPFVLRGKHHHYGRTAHWEADQVPPCELLRSETLASTCLSAFLAHCHSGQIYAHAQLQWSSSRGKACERQLPRGANSCAPGSVVRLHVSWRQLSSSSSSSPEAPRKNEDARGEAQ